MTKTAKSSPVYASIAIGCYLALAFAPFGGQPRVAADRDLLNCLASPSQRKFFRHLKQIYIGSGIIYFVSIVYSNVVPDYRTIAASFLITMILSHAVKWALGKDRHRRSKKLNQKTGPEAVFYWSILRPAQPVHAILLRTKNSSLQSCPETLLFFLQYIIFSLIVLHFNLTLDKLPAIFLVIPQLIAIVTTVVRDSSDADLMKQLRLDWKKHWRRANWIRFNFYMLIVSLPVFIFYRTIYSADELLIAFCIGFVLFELILGLVTELVLHFKSIYIRFLVLVATLAFPISIPFLYIYTYRKNNASY